MADCPFTFPFRLPPPFPFPPNRLVGRSMLIRPVLPDNGQPLVTCRENRLLTGLTETKRNVADMISEGAGSDCGGSLLGRPGRQDRCTVTDDDSQKGSDTVEDSSLTQHQPKLDASNK